MGFPIYQIKMYQKAPPITKYIKITQEITHFQYNLKVVSFYASQLPKPLNTTQQIK